MSTPAPSLPFEIPTCKFATVSQIAGAYAGDLSGFEVSPDGCWGVTSSTYESQNFLSLCDIGHSRVYGIVDMGDECATSLCWVSGTDFILGCRTGKAYHCRVRAGKNFLHVVEIKLDGCSRPILSLAFHEASALLALAAGHEVIVVRHNVGWEWNISQQFEPFPNQDTDVTCLSFFGSKQICLFAGGKAGAYVVLLDGKGLRCIFGNYDLQIAKCAVSTDGWHLVTSTLDQTVVIWTLRDSGPIAHSRTVLRTPAPAGSADAGTDFISPVAICSSNLVVYGTSTGYLHFASAVTRERCGRLRYNDKFHSQGFATHGNYLYAAVVDNYGRGAVVCFTNTLGAKPPSGKTAHSKQAQPPFTVSFMELPSRSLVLGHGSVRALAKPRFALGILLFAGFLAASSLVIRVPKRLCDARDETQVDFIHTKGDNYVCLTYRLLNLVLGLRIYPTGLTLLNIGNRLETCFWILGHAAVCTLVYWGHIIVSLFTVILA